MASFSEVLSKLQKKARSDQVGGMARFGIAVEKRLGVSVPEMRKIAKEAGMNHELAQSLWKIGIAEAMIVASMVDIPEAVTESQMERWVKDFRSWDVCDQVCMNLFEKTSLAWKKIQDWSIREEEFVKRAAFALIACLAWHNKKAQDEDFIKLFPLIKKGAADGRNFVKKAVSWALRNIGKCNPDLNRAAIETAKDIAKMEAASTRWVASDVLRDLASEATKRRINSRSPRVSSARR